MSRQFKDLVNDTFNSQSFKNIIKDLKQVRFDELFEGLKYQSLQEYEGWSIDQLNQTLIKILNQRWISEEDFKTTVKLILAGADVNAKDASGATALMRVSSYGYKKRDSWIAFI